MVDFLPSTVDSVADEDRDPKVVGVDSEEADALVAALSSQTGRDIFAALYEEPATPATIAERVDTSLQNAQYHLGKLEDGNLVEVADTAYSEKGREMNVYAPTAEPLVLFAGNESDTVGLKSALSNLLGGLGVLGLASLVVQRLANGKPLIGKLTFSSGGGDSNSADKAASTTTAAKDSGANGGYLSQTTHVNQTGGHPGADGATSTATDTAASTTSNAVSTTAHNASTTVHNTSTTVHHTTTHATRTVSEGAASAGIPPGLLFFAGGALILVLAFAFWYRRAKRGGER